MNNDSEIVINTDEFEQSEESNTFFQTILINAKQLAKIKSLKFDLHKTHGFSSLGLRKYLSRENIVYYGLVTKEYPVKMTSTTGIMKVPIITNNDIREKLATIPEADRAKIGYLSISTVQVILKSTFAEGIDSPIELSLFDERFRLSDNMKLGKLRSNLAYTTIKFNVNVRYGIPLVTRNFAKTIGFGYNFFNTRLMHENEYPFTLTYRVNYALTNSPHSLSFKPTETIDLDKIFDNIVQIETVPRPILENSPINALLTDHTVENFEQFPEALHRRSFTLPRLQERPFIRDLPKEEVPTPIKVSTPFSSTPQLTSAITQLRNQVNKLTTSMTPESSDNKE